MEWKITYGIAAFGSGDYNDILKLREDVLRKPLGLELTEGDVAGDSKAAHLWLRMNGRIIGTAWLAPVDSAAMKLRFLAVRPQARGIGLGSRLMRFCEGYALGRGYSRVELDARESALPFYERLGYQSTGGAYQHVGIPHRFMSKRLV